MYNGLTEEEVIKRQNKYGKNELTVEKKEHLIIKIFKTLLEPTFLLLLICAFIYLFIGNKTDSIIMFVSVIGILFIDIFQEVKTDKTLKTLKKLSAPKILVIRNGLETEIDSTELVKDDIMLIYEGVKIPADGIILKNNSIKIDESTLTGESVPVFKKLEDKSNNYFKDNYCYAGTLVVQGNAIVKVTSTGINTEYGKIGKNINEVVDTKTPLQIQTSKLIKTITIIAFILCILTCILNFIQYDTLLLKDRIIQSILSGITLTMCIIPEEYPVILTVFLSLGAYRLAKQNSLVKKLNKVETLGSVSVLCVDKTGTITQNQMTVVESWSVNGKTNDLYETMGLCCNDYTYDPMEKAMLDICIKNNIEYDHLFGGTKIKEYPFSNETKMVGTVWLHENLYIVSAKGSSDSIKKICNLTKIEEEIIDSEINKMTSKGLRVIAIAKKVLKKEEIKDNLEDYTLEFRGLVGLMDPPKKGIKKDIEEIINAGIRMIVITGDDGKTALSIANSLGIKSNGYITGAMLNKMSDEELKEKINKTNIFSRVTPEHKYRIVTSLQKNCEVVAMTGDGVNDAIALKQADIGIAMGKRGSEVSKEASDLILLDDNFRTINYTIKDGRRIYANIKRAIEYLITIHIPIALISLITPLLNIPIDNFLILPIHVVLFEFIVDPTCSIVLERIPSNKNIMKEKPRKKDEQILTKKGFIKSLIQGSVIFLTSFLTYYSMYSLNMNIYTARTISFLIIVFSNMFLVFVNSSNDLVYKNLKQMLKDKIILISTLLVIALSFIITYTNINILFKFTELTFYQFIYTIFISFISVFWYEIIKLIDKKN